MTALNLGKYVTAQEQMNPDNDLNVKLSDLFTGAPSGVSPIDKKACRCRLESPGGPDVLLFTFDLLIPTKRLTGDDVMYFIPTVHNECSVFFYIETLLYFRFDFLKTRPSLGFQS